MIFNILLAICMSSLEKCLFRPFVHLKQYFAFLLLNCKNCLDIQNTRHRECANIYTSIFVGDFSFS